MCPYRVAPKCLNLQRRPSKVREYCLPDDAGKSLAPHAKRQAGPHHWCLLAPLSVSLEGMSDIQTHHLAEAIQFQLCRQN